MNQQQQNPCDSLNEPKPYKNAHIYSVELYKTHHNILCCMNYKEASEQRHLSQISNWSEEEPSSCVWLQNTTYTTYRPAAL